MEQVELGEVYLRKTVILGYTDICAAGSRALLGLDMRIEYYGIAVPEVAQNAPACERDTKPLPFEQEFRPLQVLNCKYEEGQEDLGFSIVVINTVLPGNKCHYVANAFLDLCAKWKVERIILLSSLKLDLPKRQQDELFENCFFTERILDDYPSLPGYKEICDPFLSTMIQMLQVEGTPTNLVILPGHKAHLGQANEQDGSKQNIARFQEVIGRLTRLRFNNELSNSLKYMGENRPDENMSSMIYR